MRFLGSPTTWVAGKGCKIEGQDECEEQIHRYDLKESKSGRDIHKHFVIRYESGHAEGQFVSDILSVCDYINHSFFKSRFSSLQMVRDSLRTTLSFLDMQMKSAKTSESLRLMEFLG